MWHRYRIWGLSAAVAATVAVAADGSFAQAKKASWPPAAAVTPDQMKWQPGILPGMEMVVLEGDVKKQGPITVRMRFPDGYRLPPHHHPWPERIVMLSGTWMSARGKRYDPSALKPLPAGTFMLTNPDVPHYGEARGEVVMQIVTEGPYELIFLDPKDDPRLAKAPAAR